MNLVTIKQSILTYTGYLRKAGIPEARLEAELLLAHVLGLSRTQLHIRLETTVTQQQSRHLFKLIQRRLSHEPIAYIVGHKEFYGLVFYVNHNTLIPRPETELLVDKAIELANSHSEVRLIADIGTGSGAIAVATALHLPDIEIYAVDISPQALETAAMNCQIHKVTSRVHILQGDLLQPLPKSVDLIIANLPYISDPEMAKLENGIRLFEPNGALSGGTDGLEYIKRLLAQAKDTLRSNGVIMLEISPQQQSAVEELALQYFSECAIDIIPDLNGHNRVAILDTRSP
ncbi:MAG: peptide chain release factor N(5)-glutamine methyltransferase [Chloroflexota bacterium]|nr:peptide chain release factor N(5)-glutamine methyltransferase [Chloroflexota bacterium]